MCGILGEVKRKGNVNSFFFEKALNKLNHRGPDATGIFKLENIILGHKRLSIIDIRKSANQPFEEGNIVLVFNGEIYNYKELKKELEGKGHTFRTFSDTEVIIKAYFEWGENCVNKFDGMFAFALYDKKKNILFCSRDRIGEKPLIYFFNQNKFLFSSELPSLLELLPKSEIKISYNNLSNFSLLNFRHIPSPFTAFEGIFKLEAGHSLTLDLNSFMLFKKKYFKILKRKINKKDLFKEFDKVFSHCVTQTSYAEVPVGIFLSGGVDSSLIAAKLKNKNILAYSLGYDEDDPEIIRSNKIAKILKIKKKNIFFKDVLKKENLLELIKENIQYYGEPINLFQIIYSNIILKEMKKDGIKVAIGGSGADELFYGYDGMNILAGISKIKEYFDVLNLNLLLPRSLKNNIFLKIKRYRDHIRKKKHIKKPFRKFNYSEIFSNTSLEIPSKKLIDVFSWVGLKIENEHSITIVSDLSGSINGMEVRSPYLNKPLLEFSANLPLSYKIKSYFFKAENKYILKRYLENYLPKSLIYTKKMGFGFGISYKTFIHDYKDYFDFYFKNFLPKVNLYDSEKVYKLYLDHKKGVADNSDELINILIVLIWYEKFIN